MAKKPKYYSTWIHPKTGNVHFLLNPSRKGAKYAHELRTGKRFTNAGQPKNDKYGNQMTLNREQRSYRSGYLQSRKDNANCWKSKQYANKR